MLFFCFSFLKKYVEFIYLFNLYLLGIAGFTNTIDYVVLLMGGRKQSGFRGSLRSNAVNITRVLSDEHATLLKVYLFAIRPTHEMLCVHLASTTAEKESVRMSFKYEDRHSFDSIVFNLFF